MLPKQIGRYRVTGELGEGGMGRIFSAFDETLNRTVALKVISARAFDDDRARRLLLREARTAAALDHPFICTIHEVLEDTEEPVIVMERVVGETLTDRIRRGSLSSAQLCRYGIEIAEALAAAHARGIVHRDIKSGNIMLTESDHVKVMDFGLAVISSHDADTLRRSQTAAPRMVGTLPYMAPELLRGHDATTSSDLYAFGIVMYEMATGRRPFVGTTDAVLITAIVEDDPLPPRQLNPAVPRPLSDLILSLLSKEAHRRRPSAAAVVAELQALEDPKAKRKQRSLAVLPFRPLVHDPESAHLGVGLADAITSELALVRCLLVRPTSAILRFQDTDAIVAGRELNVDAVVAGTYQRAGSRLRVTVQLISVADDSQLWSTKVDATLDDLFAMQDHVSRKIVDALQLELTPGDEHRLTNRIQATGDVLELCIRGRVALLQETVADLNAAIEIFDQARRIDPGSPLPLVGLSEAYSRLEYWWDPEGGWDEKAKEMCDRALELDPELPEGHYLRAVLVWTPKFGFDHEAAMRELMIAVEMRPNMLEAKEWLGAVLNHVGLIDESLAYTEQALRINPDDNRARSHRARQLMSYGRFSEAIEEATDRSAIDAWAAYTLGLGYAHLGDLDAAGATLQAASRKFPGTGYIHAAQAVVAALRNDHAAMRRLIERTIQNRKPYGHFHHAEFDVGCALAIAEDFDEAIQWLRASAKNGYPCLPAFANDPFLAPIRSDARFRELIAALMVTHNDYRALYEELLRKHSNP